MSLRVCWMPRCTETHIQPCRECSADNCDFWWINNLWEDNDRKFKENSLLSTALPIVIKSGIDDKWFVTYGDDKDNFCYYGVSQKQHQIVIRDIYVDEKSHGKGIARKIIEELFAMYPELDIFIKCVRDSSAESFWKHMGGKQVPATSKTTDGMYERPGGNKRDLGWYIVENPHKTKVKKQLW